MKVAFVGCGAIAHKRAERLPGCQPVVCADLVEERAEMLAAKLRCQATTDWRKAALRDDVDLVFVATTPDVQPEITLAAARAGKHVLVEKPGARRAAELDPVIEACEHTGALVRVGFNHRYHPALRQARELVTSEVLGPLMFVRGRYGHGGRVGYDREWRADPRRSGGGELIDQGVHLIDLARMFLGEFTSVQGTATTCFWDMPVDDNAFLTLQTRQGQTAFLHVSCTEWRNLFSLEIYGRTGKIDISGLGGSYGTEQLTWYRMLPEMGPPETTNWQFLRGDNSWSIELDEFLEDIRLKRTPTPGLKDAQAALRVVEEVYRVSGYLSEPRRAA